MIEKLTDYLIKRRLKKDRIPVEPGADTPKDHFKRVSNTLRENRVMIDTRFDGIYIRMAGSVGKGQAFSLDWARVVKFKDMRVRGGEGIKFPTECVRQFGQSTIAEKLLATPLELSLDRGFGDTK